VTDATSLLLDHLHTAGLTDVVAVEPVAGGLPRGGDGTSVFVKAFGEPPAADVFTAEAKGLTVLREAGVATPEVILADRDLLVLDVLRPRPDTEAFWERLARTLAHLHTTTRRARFGVASGQLAGPSPAGQHLE